MLSFLRVYVGLKLTLFQTLCRLHFPTRFLLCFITTFMPFLHAFWDILRQPRDSRKHTHKWFIWIMIGEITLKFYYHFVCVSHTHAALKVTSADSLCAKCFIFDVPWGILDLPILKHKPRYESYRSNDIWTMLLSRTVPYPALCQSSVQAATR